MDVVVEDRIRLLDIADSIGEIQGYVGDSSYEDFIKEEDQMQAVSSHLLQIGGAAALLSDEFKDKYPEMDWDVLKGLQYANYDKELELDYHSIWQIINVDLAEILQSVTDLALTIEKQEMADSEIGLELKDLEAPEDLITHKRPAAQETEEEAWSEIERINHINIVRLPSEKMDRLEIEDDSFIDKRFEDVDLMGDSELDDEVYPTEEEKL